MLRLKTEPIALLVNLANFACDAAVQKVAAVELYTGLCRVDLHHPAAAGLINSRRKRETASDVIEHPVMIVTSPCSQLLVLLIHSCAYESSLGEVHGRPLNAAQ